MLQYRENDYLSTQSNDWNTSWELRIREEK